MVHSVVDVKMERECECKWNIERNGMLFQFYVLLDKIMVVVTRNDGDMIFLPFKKLKKKRKYKKRYQVYHEFCID